MVSENDVRRLFLQAIISRRVVSKELAQILWTKCIEAVLAANESLGLPGPDDRGAWDNLLGQVNESLDQLDLEFRHFQDEVTGREMYALVNRRGDEIAQMATDYSATEIAYFKAIVEQIMCAPHESFSVSSLAALREVNSLKSNMTKAQAEVVLGSFVARGWLIKSPRGRYSLATRTLVELGPYLKSTYPDELIECTICLEIITRGVACFTPNCKSRMHIHCFRTYRQRHQTCPACSKKWPQGIESPLVQVGENAIKNGQDDNRRGIRKKSAAENQSSSQDQQDQDIGEDGAAEGSRTQPKKEKKTVRMAVSGHDDSEDDAPRRTQSRRSRR